MDITTTTIYKPLFHEHPLFFSGVFLRGGCDGCHVVGITYGGYYCNDPHCSGAWLHKKCAEAPLEINLSIHPHHPLLFTKNSGDGPCELCGQKLLSPCYSCPICEFSLDFPCGLKLLQPMSHDHPLVFLKKRAEESPCEICRVPIRGPSYSCLECHVYFHVECIHLSTEVNNPFHSDHPLKLTATVTLTNYAEKTCHLCELQGENVLYHCPICNFTICLQCTRNPRPFVIENMKTHKHPLTFLRKRISFTCDGCGGECGEEPYLCLQCAFVIQGMCTNLPRVININRHDRRISLTLPLGSGYSKCGVCRQNVSQNYGAYSCSVCPNYAVHFHCAINFDVWDFVELEGIPDDEYIAPFKMVGDDLISHFSHEKHHLKLYKDNILYDERLRCEACIYPVGFNSIYVCEECCFVLHEKCANLPMKKRLLFQPLQYTLEVSTDNVEYCKWCRTLTQGFQYVGKNRHFYQDVLCGSLSEPLVHDGHLHPLYFDKNEDRYCNGCHDGTAYGHFFSCGACDFYLCFYCACLPEKIWHRNDEHPLTLYCGEKASRNNFLRQL